MIFRWNSSYYCLHLIKVIYYSHYYRHKFMTDPLHFKTSVCTHAAHTEKDNNNNNTNTNINLYCTSSVHMFECIDISMVHPQFTSTSSGHQYQVCLTLKAMWIGFLLLWPTEDWFFPYFRQCYPFSRQF